MRRRRQVPAHRCQLRELRVSSMRPPLFPLTLVPSRHSSHDVGAVSTGRSRSKKLTGGLRGPWCLSFAKDRLIDELLVRIHVSLSGGDERGGEFLRPVHHHVVTACEADQLPATIVFEARAELLEYDYRATGLAIRMLTMRKSAAVATVPRAADRRCHGANCQDPPRITRRAQFPVSQAEPSDGAPS